MKDNFGKIIFFARRFFYARSLEIKFSKVNFKPRRNVKFDDLLYSGDTVIKIK